MPENIFGQDDGLATTAIKAADSFFNTDDITTIDEEEGKPTPSAKATTKKPLLKPEEEEENEEEKKAQAEAAKSKAEAESKFFANEPDETEETEEEKEETKEEEGKPKESDNQFEYLSQQLYESGIFQPLDGEQLVAKDEGEFGQLFRSQSIATANEWLDGVLSKYGDDRRELFDAVFLNGVDPAKYLPVYNNVQALENISLDDESNQERVVREFYRRNGIPEEKITKKIDKLKETSYLQEESEDVYPQLLAQDVQNKERMELEAKTRIQNEAAQDSLYKNNLIKILQESLKAKEVGGVPLSDKAANEAFDFMYTKRYKTADGKKLTEWDVMVNELSKPENLKNKLMMSLLYKSGFDFSKIKAKAISSESNQLFSKFAKKDSSKKTNKNTSDPVDLTWGKEL